MKRRKAIKLTFNNMAYATVLGLLGNVTVACNKVESLVEELQILNKDRSQILTIIADLMIPGSSDLPGAIDVGVIKSIDSYLAHFLSSENQKSILIGLDNINVLSQNNFNLPLIELNQSELNVIMEYLAEDAERSPNKRLHLFYLLREMIVRSYFESEIVARNILKYDPNPQEYLGCIPLENVGGQWTL
jgi:hypothetical protein